MKDDRSGAPRSISPLADRGEGPVALPIDGVLDLHGFRPRDVREIVSEYLRECQSRGILEVRLVHGKGIGEQRRAVQALLTGHPEVERFADASPLYGGLGATMVWLRPKHDPSDGAAVGGERGSAG